MPTAESMLSTAELARVEMDIVRSRFAAGAKLATAHGPGVDSHGQDIIACYTSS